LSLTDIDVYALDPDESDRQDVGSARRRWRLVWRRAGNCWRWPRRFWSPRGFMANRRPP